MVPYPFDNNTVIKMISDRHGCKTREVWTEAHFESTQLKWDHENIELIF